MDAHSFGSQFLFGKRSGNDACRRLAGTRSSTASPIADAVFLLIDAVGMTDAVGMFEPFVVLGACVFVADQKSNRRTEGDEIALLTDRFTDRPLR